MLGCGQAAKAYTVLNSRCGVIHLLKTSFSRYIVYPDGRIYDTKSNKFCKTFKSNKYTQCCLFDNDNKKHVLGVHTVVAMFHCDDYFEGCVVHHVDEDTRNNSASNLRCTTRSKHSRFHANADSLIKYIKENGPPNKGKKMSKEFCEKCSKSAKRRWDMAKR